MNYTSAKLDKANDYRKIPNQVTPEYSNSTYKSNSKYETTKSGGIFTRRPRTDTNSSMTALPEELLSLFQSLCCNLCMIQLTNNTMANLHYESKDHDKKVREWLKEYDPKYYYCEVCDIPLPGKFHAEFHYRGKNHHRALQKQSLAEQGLRCEICNVSVSSAPELEMHLQGLTHKEQLQHMNNGMVASSLNENSSETDESIYSNDYRNVPTKLTPQYSNSTYEPDSKNETTESCEIFTRRPKTDTNTSMTTTQPINILDQDTLGDLHDATLPKELLSLFQPLFCELCMIQANSNTMAELHYKSKNHDKEVREWLIDYSKETGEPLHKRAGKEYEEYDPKYYHCELCDAAFTGNIGKDHHRALCDKKSPVGQGFYNEDNKSVRTVATKNDPTGRDVEDALRCGICNVSVTSAPHLEVHFQGLKHKKRLKAMDSRMTVSSLNENSSETDDSNNTNDVSEPNSKNKTTKSSSIYTRRPRTGTNSSTTTTQPINSWPIKRSWDDANANSSTPANRRYEDTLGDLHDATLPKELLSLFQPLFCKLCMIQVTNKNMAKLHYKAKNHDKQVRQWLTEYSERTGEPLHKRAVVPRTRKNEEYDPKYYHCEICAIRLDGKSNAELHYMGKNHQRALYGTKSPAGQSVMCEICNINVSSALQLEMHLQGQKHKRKLQRMDRDMVASSVNENSSEMDESNNIFDYGKYN